MSFIRNFFVLAAGVFLAALIVPGITFGDRWDTLALVVLVLALFNAVLKPIMVFFTLPFIFLTMGIGLWIINAVLLYWAAHIVKGGFVVSSFWSALAGAFVISLTSMMLSGFTRRKLRPGSGPQQPPRQPPPSAPHGDDVIDV
jgi:putative membrane protein